jgi:tripartite ATP-independent transporter DctP family solute receptor
MKFPVRLLAAASVLAFAAGAHAQTTTVRLGHPHATSGALHAGSVAFAEELAKLTNGRYKVQIFPSSALGGEKEMVEQARDGSLDLVVTSTGPVGNFVPEILPFDVPFLFRDYAHARKVMDGPIGQDALAKFAGKNMIGLAWGENGFRHITNNKRAVNSAADLQGVKLRTMQNDIHMTAFKSLGAQPTPMPFPEVFGALQSGQVDGQENPIQVITSAKFGQVQKYLTLSAHVYSPAVIIASTKVYNGLSDADKKAFRDAAVVGGKAMRKKVDELETAGVAEMKAAGVTVNTPDRASFQTALASAEYNKRFGDVLDKVRAVK